MKNNIITLLSLICFISITGCKKKKPTLDELVPKTHHGANTFGCLINGEP